MRTNVNKGLAFVAVYLLVSLRIPVLTTRPNTRHFLVCTLWTRYQIQVHSICTPGLSLNPSDYAVVAIPSSLGHGSVE